MFCTLPSTMCKEFFSITILMELTFLKMKNAANILINITISVSLNKLNFNFIYMELFTKRPILSQGPFKPTLTNCLKI